MLEHTLALVKINYIQLVYCLLAFIVLDIATGLINAFVKKCIDSTKMREGLVKKIYEIVIVVVAHILDVILGMKCIMMSATLFYILEEVISILENTSVFIKYPKVIIEALKKLKGESTDDTKLEG